MELIITAANQAAWASKSPIDGTTPQRPETLVLKNTVADVTVAGISDLVPGRLVTVINRGPFSITFAANDTAAPLPWRFSSAHVIPAGKKAALIVADTGIGIDPIKGRKVA